MSVFMFVLPVCMSKLFYSLSLARTIFMLALTLYVCFFCSLGYSELSLSTTLSPEVHGEPAAGVCSTTAPLPLNSTFMPALSKV